MAGIWLPHTSSIEFCEANYLLSRHVAEPFNAGSSLLLAIMPLIGLWAGNPTGELRWTVHWLLFVVVGLGSVCLHATLSALGQALDEVPMVWLAISFLGLMVVATGLGCRRGVPDADLRSVSPVLSRLFGLVRLLRHCHCMLGLPVGLGLRRSLGRRVRRAQSAVAGQPQELRPPGRVVVAV